MIFLENKTTIILRRKVEEIIQPRTDKDIVTTIFDNLCHKFVLNLLAEARETDKKDLLSELKVMKTLKPHPHVITLLGCVTESGKNDVFLNVCFLSKKNVRPPLPISNT